MKKNYGKWIFLMLLITGLFTTSCEKDRDFGPENKSTNLKGKIVSAYTGTMDAVDIPGNPAICDLIGGQYIYTGQVLYSNDEENLYVQYVTTGEWYLTDLHLYVGTVDGLPATKKGIPIPGQFPYKAENPGNNLTIYTFIIPLNELESNEGGCYTIAAHAVVYNDAGENETAWSKCEFNPLIILKSFITKSDDGGTFWAVSDGDPFSSVGWCKIMGTNIFDGDATYNLISNSYTDPGMIYVTRMDGKIEVKVEVVDGLQLYKTHLYVGSAEGFNNYFNSGYSGGDCPQYWTFPYKVIGEYSSTHTFTIPFSESVSFEDALGSPRWGWLSNYCPQ